MVHGRFLQHKRGPRISIAVANASDEDRHMSWSVGCTRWQKFFCKEKHEITTLANRMWHEWWAMETLGGDSSVRRIRWPQKTLMIHKDKEWLSHRDALCNHDSHKFVGSVGLKASYFLRVLQLIKEIW